MTVLEGVPPPPELEETPSPRPTASGAAPRRWKWTGDDLIRMGEAGLLPHDGRFELLDGEIFELPLPTPLHACMVGWIDDLLETIARAHAAHARQSKPIRQSLHYDPQPDVAVVRGR